MNLNFFGFQTNVLFINETSKWACSAQVAFDMIYFSN